MLTAVISITANAQQKTRPFHAYLINKEYEIYLNINFYEDDVTVPDQELHGQIPGYLGKERNSFCWVITSAKLRNEHNADLIKFEASRDYLRKRADGKKLPTLASLKQQKAGLIKRRESLYASMEHKRDAFREIDTMLRNMDAILAIPDGLRRFSYDRTRPAPARPSR